MRRVGCLAALLSAIACGGGNTTGPSPSTAGESLTMRVETAHFRVLAGSTPDAAVRAAADRLEAEYDRILSGLNVASHPIVTVRIWHARFGNNPRWLWEAVALYENDERVDPRTLDYVVRGNFPTLQQLSVDINSGTQVYQLGFLLGEFIVTEYGRPALLRLIETNADLRGVLGLSDSEFEAAFQSYVRQRYLS
jgi:hypothetical protein